MCCGVRKVSRRNWNTFGRIRSGEGWLMCRNTIVGCGWRKRSRPRPTAKAKAAGEGARATYTPRDYFEGCDPWSALASAIAPLAADRLSRKPTFNRSPAEDLSELTL